MSLHASRDDQLADGRPGRRAGSSEDDKAVYVRWLSEESSPYGFADQDGTLKQVDSRTWQRITPRTHKRFVASSSTARKTSGSTRQKSETTWLLQGFLAVVMIGLGWYGVHAKSVLGHQVKATFERAFADDYSSQVTAAFDRIAEKYHLNVPVLGTAALHYHVPMQGRVTVDFSAQHPRMVISGKANEGVLAAGSGTVSRLLHQDSSGYLVVIDHGGGRSTLYDGLATVTVHKGQSVASGQLIGRLGKNGHPTLQFAFQQDGKFVNPHDYIVWSSEEA
ncbi:murein hydrolase activator EnvC family protein [Alicyclobacillus shizuokensis]|uniref:murein hydrolase activator EnvC family protein n=1 Tax=Alicyclobacillus shizuokensis TaxID=392014 RepID=UPI000832769F|nr:M23 family metallopeptidase [Alicyclobacillus shizuokensis]